MYHDAATPQRRVLSWVTLTRRLLPRREKRGKAHACGAQDQDKPPPGCVYYYMHTEYSNKEEEEGQDVVSSRFRGGRGVKLRSMY